MQQTFFSTVVLLTPGTAAPLTPDDAVASILATLAPLHSAESVASHCCSSPFRARLVAKICALAQCEKPAALAALRRAKILP